MRQLTLDVERALRRAPDVQAAWTCWRCSVRASAWTGSWPTPVDGQHRVLRGAQWHVGTLSHLAAASRTSLSPRRPAGRATVERRGAPGHCHDFLDPDVQAGNGPAYSLRPAPVPSSWSPSGSVTGCWASFLVLTVHEPRRWTRAEANAVQQVAAFAARVLVQAEHEADQQDHVERLERLDRQKTDFMATVTHELRTPLTSISGYLELLEDGDYGDLTPGQQLGARHHRAQRHPAARPHRGPARPQQDRGHRLAVRRRGRRGRRARAGRRELRPWPRGPGPARRARLDRASWSAVDRGQLSGPHQPRVQRRQVHPGRGAGRRPSSPDDQGPAASR